MKSPIYLLTALLPLTLSLVNAAPSAEPEDIEDSVLEDRDTCRVERRFDYYKYPCQSSDRISTARRGDSVNFQCRYRNWYKTPNGWVREEDRPRRCQGPRPNSCS